MGESIKRGLSPTVGQNSLQKWLASPELASPIRRQSTELQIVQEIEPFQRKWRYHQDSQQLAGVETSAVFSVTIPVDEVWLIDWLWFEQDSGATVIAEVLHTGGVLAARQALITRAQVVTGLMTPLIGSSKPAAVASADRYQRVEPLELLPLDTLQIQNLGGLVAGDSAFLQVRYRIRPFPLERSNEGTQIWTATTN